MKTKTHVWVLALAVALGLMVTGSVGAKPRPAAAAGTDIRTVGSDLNAGVPLPVVASTINGRRTSFATATAGLKKAARAKAAKAKAAARRAAAKGASARTLSGPQAKRRIRSHTPTVGETRRWVGLDDFFGVLYGKNYVLRGIGEHIEVWVAEGTQGPAGRPPSNDLDFLAGDCRNGIRTQVTDEQVAYLIDEFDNNIYPKESEAFSVPPDRDGSNAAVPSPPFHPGGDGDNIVVLIDNVRDDNFYDLNNTNQHSYIAGFFSSQINNLFDRNIMTIDGFDWIHRTGATPPHEPVPGNPCTSAPARPFLYEGVFAHEYQHLLMEYEDPDEVNWVNEGLSDWAQTLTGYVDPSTPITEIGFDSHVQCFLGWLSVQTPANPNPRIGGPENSLTLWGDQGDDEILCDYGAAYTFMEFLHGRYGTDAMTALHREDLNGLEGLEAVLAGQGASDAMEHIRDWAAAVALDGVLDDNARLFGGDEDEYKVPTLDARINWDNPDAYQDPGAPPNGSDYVRLRDADGRYIPLHALRKLEFNGASTLPPLPIEWVVDPNPPLHAGDPALYSGTGDDFDRAIVRQVTVPAADPNLRFETLYNAELGWDFGVVQVSTNGGESYTSIACTTTTSEHDPGAIARIVAELPGFTGYSGGWLNETCSLSAYAGQTILVSFRYLTDPAVEGQVETVPPGWWIDDVSVGGSVLSDGSTLDGWQSPTQVRPIPVPNFTVQLISYSSLTGRFPFRNAQTIATITRLDLDENFDFSGMPLSLGASEFLAIANDVVAAIVTFEDPSETITQYAPYVLKANGVVQPGGGG